MRIDVKKSVNVVCIYTPDDFFTGSFTGAAVGMVGIVGIVFDEVRPNFLIA